MDWERELPAALGIVAAAGVRFVFRRPQEKKGVLRRAPVAYAHRGGASEGPENTLEAFALAVARGAEVIETDAHLSADGEVVLIHDSTVDRTTEGSGRVRNLSLKELRRLDAGYRFAPEGGEAPYRGRGVRIPTLREAYELLPEAAFNIDIKENVPGIQERLLEVVRAAGAEERTLVASEDSGRLRRFRKVSGGKVATSASPAEIGAFILLAKRHLEDFTPVPYQALQVPAQTGRAPMITPRLIEAAHRRRIRVDAWTVNELEEMKRLLDLGVDGIMTDRPKVLAALLKGRSEDPPDPAPKL